MLRSIVDETERNRRIGLKIRQAREAKGWSQYDLADELNTNAGTVSRWEGGAFPKRIGLPRIAEALGKPVEWFQIEPQFELTELEHRLEALEQAQTTTSPSEKVSEDELELLGIFRAADPIRRRSIIKFARGIAFGHKEKVSTKRRRRG